MARLLKRIARRLLPQSAGRWLGRPSAVQSALTLAGQLRQAGLSFAEWHARRRHQRRLYARPSPEALAWLRRHLPAEVAATVAAADQILEHRFDLLGSGPFQPVDPDREPTADGYRPIDWYLDPVRGLRFPRGIPHRQWNLQTMRPGLADIKLPWELARCQHWPLLAQAYLLTGASRYAIEIARQLDDFMQANPVGIGINWTCTMDVALRAANWALALEMVTDSPALTDTFWRQAHEALFDHGVFIRTNLENHYEVTSNHFLSNLVGLYYLSAVFADLPEGRAWSRFCRDGLENEIRVQVLDDGADYESSVPYHRLVTELFLGAARLAAYRGEPFSEEYRGRLRRMIEFLLAVLRPDGRMPQVGDADNGRLHIFTGYGRWDPQDGRHLLAPASRFFGEPLGEACAGEAGAWEAVWWGYEPKAPPAPAGPLPPSPLPSPPPGGEGKSEGGAVARLFPDAGLVVVRDRECYLLITNGVVGTRGFGNHKHNDQLSFEYHLDGLPLLVDPGSYVYTSDPDARNRFRSTAYHNTLCIDGVEQNELRPEWLFRLFEKAQAEHLEFRASPGVVEYRGQHVGYQRLSEPVIHERRFLLRCGEKALSITDRLTGGGRHTLAWHFHLAPGVQADLLGPGVVRLEASGRRYRLVLPADLDVRIGPAWYSPFYGVRVPCQAIDARKEVRLNGEAVFEFAVAPLK
ncbi:MAG TPA: alginate lyase family protein [Gemmataceae bacterium]|nr:alginate lyase family protein [Gemmataceae bacterium]